MPHRGKLKFPQYDFSPVPHPKRTSDGIHSGGRARHQSDFLWIGAYEPSEDPAGLLISFNPDIPWRALLVPNLKILSERAFHTLRERSLGAAVEVHLSLENGELRADRQDRAVIECQERLLQFYDSRSSLFRTVSPDKRLQNIGQIIGGPLDAFEMRSAETLVVSELMCFEPPGIRNNNVDRRGVGLRMLDCAF